MSWKIKNSHFYFFLYIGHQLFFLEKSNEQILWKIGILAFLDQQMSHFLKIQTVNFTDLIMPASRYIFWKFLLNFYIFRLKKNQRKEFWAQKWPKFKCLSLGIILEKATNWFRGGKKLILGPKIHPLTPFWA